MVDKVRVCILRVGGTNCDIETKAALDDFVGVDPEIVHINHIGRDRDLMDYDALVIPGGFSYGDHIRAGVVFAKRIITTLSEELRMFVEEERPVLGICNGFQVLIEAGFLPGFEGPSEFPTAALAINESVKYECRWVHLRNENEGKCIFTRELGKGENVFVPVAHKEGRFIFPRKLQDEFLERLLINDQLVFQYSNEQGDPAEGRYPENPNGSFHDIAGICDPTGTILGLMPHPERAYYGWQRPDWTGHKNMLNHADGRVIFESLVEYLLKNS